MLHVIDITTIKYRRMYFHKNFKSKKINCDFQIILMLLCNFKKFFSIKRIRDIIYNYNIQIFKNMDYNITVRYYNNSRGYINIYAHSNTINDYYIVIEK